MARLLSGAVKTDIGAAIGIAFLSLTYALSYGALLFSSPELSPFISYTITASLITTIVTVVLVAMLSGIRFSIAGPNSNTVAVLASFILIVSERAISTGLSGIDLAFFALTALCLITMFTALTMVLMGRFNLGNFVRFVPVSVAGGFLAAAGCLMMNGAFYLATGFNTLDLLTTDLSALDHVKLGGLLIFAVFFWSLSMFSNHQMALPVGIFAAILAIHFVIYQHGLSLHDAQAAGLLLDTGGNSTIFNPLVHGMFDINLLSTLLGHIPELIVTVAVTSLSILLIIAGIELDQNIDGNLNHELKIHGYAIGLSGIFGGYIGLVSLSRSLLNADKISRLPVAAAMTTVICGTAIILGGTLTSLLPQIALGALVLFLGAQIAYRWMVKTYATLDRFEYLLVLVICFTTLFAGFIFGLGLGVVAGCILFAARASFVSVVRQELSGEAYRSRVVRSPDEEAYLSDLNRTIRIYELQGFLFFGTAHNFYTKIKDELEQDGQNIRHIILSFKHVTGIDASADQILQKIFRTADRQRCAMSTVELPVQGQITLARLLRRAPTLIADRNYAAIYDAMEAIEENLLCEREFGGSLVSLESWLERRLNDPEMAHRLFSLLEKENFASGDTICAQNEAADDIYFLDIGRIDVVIHDVPGQPFRIYSYMRHTMLGEMGFVRNETRSAQLVARGPTTIYKLRRETYNDLVVRNDAIIGALLHLIAITLSDRIISANRTITELQA